MRLRTIVWAVGLSVGPWMLIIGAVLRAPGLIFAGVAVTFASILILAVAAGEPDDEPDRGVDLPVPVSRRRAVYDHDERGDFRRETTVLPVSRELMGDAKVLRDYIDRMTRG
jgi:hypothetical protein